jgi:hypothetical protein
VHVRFVPLRLQRSQRPGVLDRREAPRLGPFDAVYDLQEYDADFNPVGDPVAMRIVTNWTGMGSLSREKSSDSIHAPCGVIQYTSRGVSRAAEATGSLDGVDLGETYDAYLARGTSRSVEA